MQDNNWNPENQQPNQSGPIYQPPHENINPVNPQNPVNDTQSTTVGNINTNGQSGFPHVQPPVSPDLRTEVQVPIAATKNVKKSKKVVLFGIISLLVAGVAAYLIYSSQDKPAATTKSSDSVSEPTACSSETCFTPYFTSCSPAILTFSSPIASVKYQTYAKKDAGCSMLFEYTSNPNPAWVNQPMTCSFDNTKSLEDSISAVINDLGNKKNTYSCTGPLVQVLQNL